MNIKKSFERYKDSMMIIWINESLRKRPERKKEREKKSAFLSFPGFGIAGFDAIDVERWQTSASDAISFFLPLLSSLEDFPGLRGILATARLLGARDCGLATILLAALASVTVLFEGFVNFIGFAIFLATMF